MPPCSTCCPEGWIRACTPGTPSVPSPTLPTKTKPIRVAYGAIEVPVVAPLLTDESVGKRSIFDLLVKMKDPGEAIAELEALAARSRLGADPITGLLRYSEDSPTPSIPRHHPSRRIGPQERTTRPSRRRREASAISVAALSKTSVLAREGWR